MKSERRRRVERIRGAESLKSVSRKARIGGPLHLPGSADSCKCAAESARAVRRAVIGFPGGDFISARYTRVDPLSHPSPTVAFAMHFPISVDVDRAARQMHNGSVARALPALSILSARYPEARRHARHLLSLKILLRDDNRSQQRFPSVY